MSRLDADFAGAVADTMQQALATASRVRIPWVTWQTVRCHGDQH